MCINLRSERAVKIIQETNKRIDIVQADLEKEARIDAQGAILRSGVRWYEQAEVNSKYFLGLEKVKGRNKVMNSITDDIRVEEYLIQRQSLRSKNPSIKNCIQAIEK